MLCIKDNTVLVYLSEQLKSSLTYTVWFITLIIRNKLHEKFCLLLFFVHKSEKKCEFLEITIWKILLWKWKKLSVCCFVLAWYKQSVTFPPYHLHPSPILLPPSARPSLPQSLLPPILASIPPINSPSLTASLSYPFPFSSFHFCLCITFTYTHVWFSCPSLFLLQIGCDHALTNHKTWHRSIIQNVS